MAAENLLKSALAALLFSSHANATDAGRFLGMRYAFLVSILISHSISTVNQS